MPQLDKVNCIFTIFSAYMSYYIPVWDKNYYISTLLLDYNFSIIIPTDIKLELN